MLTQTDSRQTTCLVNDASNHSEVLTVPTVPYSTGGYVPQRPVPYKDAS